MTVSARPVRTAARRGTALLCAVAASLALAACGGGPPGPGAGGGGDITDEQAQYNPQPYDNLRDGGTLTTAITEISPQFNLFQGDSTAYTRTIWNWYNPLMITFTADGDAVFNPDYLADVKPETVDGNTRITYTINPKAVYNDGTPIDWRSFESVWKSNSGLDRAYIPNSTDGYDRIASVTRGADDRQAVVTFKGIDLWWPSLFNNPLHPKALDPAVFNQGYLNNPHPEWGAGPYMLDRFDKQNGTISFVRNPKWWGKKGKLDSRTFLVMESSASINAFKNGQTDATGVGSKDRLAQVKGMAGIDIRKSVSPSLAYLTLNGESPILSDVRVRKAVFTAIDRKQLMEIEFQGLDYTGRLAGSMVLNTFQKGYQDVVSKVVTFDPEQAKRELDAAGWTVGPDGIRVKDGKPLRFTYVNLGDDPIGKADASAIAAMLKNVGIALDIRQLASSEFSAVIGGKKFDMFYSGITASDSYGIAYICQVYCSDTTLLKSGVNDPKLDPEVRAVNTLPTPEQQYAKAVEVETKALQTYGVLPTTESPDIFATKKGLANYGAGRFFTTSPENIGWQK
jgi:peptide/nickel transport system substrate-binding protein